MGDEGRGGVGVGGGCKRRYARMTKMARRMKLIGVATVDLLSYLGQPSPAWQNENIFIALFIPLPYDTSEIPCIGEQETRTVEMMLCGSPTASFRVS